jgi:hypothetical protein
MRAEIIDNRSVLQHRCPVMHRIPMFCAALAAILSASAALAAETTISDPNSAKWLPYGAGKPKYEKTEGIPGGVALRVTVRSKGKNPWDTGVSAQMMGDVAQGDVVVAGFFARVETPPKNRQTATIIARVQQNALPFDSATQATFEIDGTWTFYCVEGTAKRSIGKGSLELSLQLASDKQVLDIGPFMVTKRDAGGKSGLPCQKQIKAE